MKRELERVRPFCHNARLCWRLAAHVRRGCWGCHDSAIVLRFVRSAYDGGNERRGACRISQAC